MTGRWKSGKADEAWKVLICGQNVSEADRAMQSLVRVLTDAGPNFESGIAQIEAMTGKQIMDGLRNYRATALESIDNALKKR